MLPMYNTRDVVVLVQVDSHNKWLHDVVAHCENKV